jgi:phage shock protein A
MEALKRGDKRRTLSAIKECRRARAALSKRARDAITNEYRVDATTQEINMSGVNSFMAAMAPMRIVDLEEEIKGLDQTLRDIDTILARPKKKKATTDESDACIVDLSSAEEVID